MNDRERKVEENKGEVMNMLIMTPGVKSVAICYDKPKTLIVRVIAKTVRLPKIMKGIHLKKEIFKATPYQEIGSDDE